MVSGLKSAYLRLDVRPFEVLFTPSIHPVISGALSNLRILAIVLDITSYSFIHIYQKYIGIILLHYLRIHVTIK
jgi:hypothetical protein